MPSVRITQRVFEGRLRRPVYLDGLGAGATLFPVSSQTPRLIAPVTATAPMPTSCGTGTVLRHADGRCFCDLVLGDYPIGGMGELGYEITCPPTAPVTAFRPTATTPPPTTVYVPPASPPTPPLPTASALPPPSAPPPPSVPLDQQEAPPPAESAFVPVSKAKPMWFWPAVGLGAAGLLGLGVFLFGEKRKRRG